MPKKIMEEKEIKQPKYNPQKAFEAALDGGKQETLVEREHADEFPFLSTWKYGERTYQVYMILNAGPDHVKIGFMPVNNA